MEEKTTNLKGEMNMFVMVDQDECLGCGSCEAVAPEVFEMNGDGKAEAPNEVTDAQKDSVEEAMSMCPVNCIHWEEE